MFSVTFNVDFIKKKQCDLNIMDRTDEDCCFGVKNQKMKSHHRNNMGGANGGGGSHSDASTTSDNTSQFIDIVKKNDIVYNTHHPDYKNVEVKLKVWTEIASEIGLSIGMCERQRYFFITVNLFSYFITNALLSLQTIQSL